MRGKAQKKKKKFPLDEFFTPYSWRVTFNHTFGVECYPQLFLLGNFVLHRGKWVVPVIPKITEGVRGIKYG